MKIENKNNISACLNYETKFSSASNSVNNGNINQVTCYGCKTPSFI